MKTDFKSIFDDMKIHGLRVSSNKVQINIPRAKKKLQDAMEYALSLEGRHLVWLPQYDEVADWLEDNEGRGLLLYGSCGLGKTLITRYAIIPILLKFAGKVISSYDMVDLQKNADEIISKHLLALDDIGTEETYSMYYGQKRSVFSEIVDAAEKGNKLLLMTTNLSAETLMEKYQPRTFDRLLALTKRIEFKGASFRK